MKELINNLRDYAELAQASYFNFMYINNDEREMDSYKIGQNRFPKDKDNIENLEYTKTLSKKYKDYFIYDDSIALYPTLNGEFGEIQAKNFAKKYEIKFHQPNTASGFSATLFYDKEKDKFVVGFRGTEGLWSMDTLADIGLTFGKGDFQLNALKQFLLDIAPILNKVDSNNIIFIGHSLGGYLAVIAMQFCDTIDRSLNTQFNAIKFMASQVYTFNSPAIDEIDNMLMRALAALLDKNIMEQVLNPQKVYCVYDSGGINIIASAQYGSHNRLPIYTGKDSHSIIPLTQTLYFYSYLLELDANHNKVKDKSFSECIEYLNHFMKNIQIYTETFVLKNNAINNKNFALKNGPLGLLRSSPKKINHFEYFLSLIATIMQETNGILEEVGDNYYTSYKAPTISQIKIIDFILKAHEKEKYILILDKNDFNKYRKDSSFINNQENLAHKIAIGEFRIFIVVYKDMKCLENINNITKIYRYNSKSYKIKDQIWDEQYLGGVCKISQALYFNGKAKIGII
ncbi:lipase family protein [Campylobacter sp. IFREMER_LSEM_CL2194]|uniref:lipase family protein n=1 Tax=Campylobacter sp. IFREMER_LSEM_CL2194 TaxID=2911621 RepID=UPI0021E79C6B|nr:lipase family protein [Campylobacter sp. IFREMER_LSEM_CL2194]MCV3377784.1 lipase family protein [Campylobacter sp. IFREMER_LSEM_CL2194]